MQFDFSKLGKVFGLTRSGVSAVGVDIGTSSIKVVELQRKRGGAALVTYGEVALGPYAGIEIGHATNLDSPKLSGALTDILREASVSGTQAGFSIAASSSFLAVVELPAADEVRLASMVPIEARKYVPVPMSEVSLDWSVLPNVGTEKVEENGGAASVPERVRVLLAALHNSALEKYRDVIQQAGLTAAFSEIEAFSAIRSSVPKEEPRVALIDFGAAATRLYVVANGLVERTHSVGIGAQDLTLALSEALELSVADAEERKRQDGIAEEAQDARVAAALTPVLERLMHDLARALAVGEGEGTAVSKVLLSGGGALLPGMGAYAETQLERPVTLVEPFTKVTYPPFLEETLVELGPTFSVALGAALRQLEQT